MGRRGPSRRRERSWPLVRKKCGCRPTLGSPPRRVPNSHNGGGLALADESHLSQAGKPEVSRPQRTVAIAPHMFRGELGERPAPAPGRHYG